MPPLIEFPSAWKRVLLVPSLLLVVVGCGQRAAAPSSTVIASPAAAAAPASAVPVAAEPVVTGPHRAAVQEGAVPAKNTTSESAAEPAAAWAAVPRVEHDDQRQAASVAEAIRTGAHPERLTPHVLPAPFDRAAYAKDPAAYLAVVQPGRCYQMADTGPGVPSLITVSPSAAATGRDGSIPLTVRTLPRAPVTFTTFDLGAFANNQISTTVQADDDGVATALWRPTPGTDNHVTVLAASPVVSEQAHFVLTVLAESQP